MNYEQGPKFSYFGSRSPPVFNLPPVVTWLVVAMVLVHVLRVAIWLILPASVDGRIISFLGFVPIRVLNLVGADGLSADLVLGVAVQLVPFVSHIFLHADIMHLSFNLLWMMAFGTAVARRLGPTTSGRTRFILFFLVCGVAGAVAHLLSFSEPTFRLIGASGAISGLMGGAIRFIFVPPPLYQVRPDGLSDISNPRVAIFAIIFVALNMLIGLTGMLDFTGDVGAIAWQAHLGGFFAGLLLFGFFVRK